MYNTFSGKLIKLRSPLTEILDATPSLEDTFRKMGFIVDDSVSPKDEYALFFATRAKTSRNIYLLFTTTTTCDLACGYCFENRVARTSMSKEVLQNTIRWLHRRILKTSACGVSVTLFGGEPMLAVSLAFDALEGIRHVCDMTGAKMHPILMTTNGLHSDTRTLERLRNLGVASVQITLDGDAATNDARRRRRKDPNKKLERGSVYEQILRNLKTYQAIFELNIKVNFDKTTVQSVPALLDDLLALAGLRPGTFQVKPEPIALSKSARNSETAPSSLFDPQHPEMALAFANIIDHCSARGIPLDLSAVFPTPCMVSQENSFLVEPNGTLRSCISAFGLDAFKVGTVSEDVGPDNNRDMFTADSHTVQDCLSFHEGDPCPYLPVCDGGCKYEVHLSGLPIKTMYCRYDYFTEAVPVYVSYVEKHANYVHSFGLPSKVRAQRGLI